MPSLMVAIRMTLASALVETHTDRLNQSLRKWPRLFGVGAEDARLIWSIWTGSMMTAMGIAFFYCKRYRAGIARPD